MFSFNKEQKGGHVSVLIDIGSGSVGASLVLEREDQLPHFLYQKRVRMRAFNNDKDHLRSMREALLESTLELASRGVEAVRAAGIPPKVENIRIVTTAPWARTRTLVFKTHEDVPFVVTQKHLNAMLEEAEKQATLPEDELNIYKEFGLHIGHRTVVEHKLNGYRVNSILGKEAKDITLVELVELLPEVIGEVITEAERNLFPHIPRTEHARARVISGALANLFPHTPDFLIIDASGEATEAALVHDNLLWETAFMPIGLFSLERLVAKELKTIQQEATGHFRAFGEKNGDPQVTEVMTAVGDSYAKALEKLFSTLKASYAIPRTVFLLTSLEYLAFLQKFATRALENTLHGDFKVIPLDSKILKQAATGAGTDEAFLPLEAFFFHTEKEVD